MLESEADRLAMLSSLGGQPIAGPDGEFTGLLETPAASVGDDVPVDSSAPLLYARTSDVKRTGVSAGVRLSIDGQTYIARSVRPDGTGMTEIQLEGP
jgi:hypothetical protein